MSKKLQWGRDIGCLSCKNFNPGKWGTCKAFPEGIPHQIVSGEMEHSEPVEDQENDIVYEQITE